MKEIDFVSVVVGSGFMGHVHTEALRRLGSVEVVSIGGKDEAGLRDLLERQADYVDAVHICTPNSSHFRIAKLSLEAGKHVLCEKPLATSVRDAETLVELAKARKCRNCTCHNLRYYPMVQHMRCMCEDGDLGEILIVQGTYSQDWLLYDTDSNWRIDPKQSGPSRALADIGSHWCDMAEHITGQRITAVCADLQIFHKSRNTEDFGAVIFRMGDRARGAFTASQVSAGRKNRLSIEIYGTKSGVAWDQERPDELWIGHRNAGNQVMIKDPALLKEGARSYADLPGGHSEGYDDTFKQVFRRFYASIENPEAEPEYPQFADGLRQLIVLEAELESNHRRAWEHVR